MTYPNRLSNLEAKTKEPLQKFATAVMERVRDYSHAQKEPGNFDELEALRNAYLETKNKFDAFLVTYQHSGAQPDDTMPES